MPGRAARGGRRTTAASKQASSRKSKDAEVTPPQTANAEPATALQRTIRNAFASAQNTTATHRKLVVTLRSQQEENAGKGRPAEDDFNQEFVRCLSRALAVKKGENAADRILRFCNMFVRHIHEKELKARQEAKRAAKLAQGIPDEDVEMEDEEEEEEEEEEIPATFTTRFTAFVLKFLVKGLDAANKTVRYRICQFLALILKDISAMDETAWRGLKQGLIKRLLDREAAVRSQASLALVKMGFGIIEEEESEEDSDDDEEKPVGGVVERLVDRLSNDPSADVRRSILLNLNHSPLTLPHLLERARDTEALTRRLVYSRTLPALGDFRLLSISMREKILRWGLEDRDPNVRKATERTFAESWVANANGDLLEVLERLDVVNSKVAELAMESFWKQGTGAEVEFTHDFWQNLTAEAAFLARTFNDYCRDPQTKFDHHIDEKIPEVTHLAFVVQKYINLLVESPEGVPLSRSQDGGAQQLDSSELEFIVEQLLLIALKLDYGDEIGRRKMFALLRESLALVDLPDGTVKRIAEVIRKLSGGEREFCSVILEIIAEVHDTISPPEEEGDGENTEGEESFHSATSDQEDEGGAKKKKRKPKKKVSADGDEEMGGADDDEDADEKAIKEMVTNMKCLYIAQCMLENVEGDLNSNAHLVTMLNGLVVPAVRSQEAPIRERGLRCLGLCCLLDKTLAEENLALFAHCFNKGHEELQIEAVQIICDILVSHGSTIFESETCTIEQKILYKMLYKAIKLDDSPDVQAAVVEVLCKLMLARVIEDEDLLKAVVVAYFDPSTIDNLSLRQILSYFLPVFCHSRDENQVRMASITAAALHTLFSMHASLDEDEVMITPAAMSAQFADWTDPRKVFGAIEGAGMAGPKVNYDVHVDVANAIFERILGGGNKDEKKTFCQMLGKLYITHHATPEKLQQLYEAVVEAIEGKAVTDAVSRNSLTKFEVTLGKVVSTVEEGLQNEGDITIATLRSSKGGGEEGDDDDNDDSREGDETMAAGDESILSTITVATTRAPGDDTRVEDDDDDDDDGEEEEEEDEDDDEEE